MTQQTHIIETLKTLTEIEEKDPPLYRHHSFISEHSSKQNIFLTIINKQ